MSFDDRSRGFVHLDSFEELHQWSCERIDPLERSNTPLLRRNEADQIKDGKSKVMLIHDYQGSYLDYESCQGAVVGKEQYSCEYLQHVEVFVYFSHKLVTIPPPTWTNACHRAGVKVLGTFIVEPDTPYVEQILEDQNGAFWVAGQLAAIADAYGFDGWLINLERPFPLLYWSGSKLEAFLRQLRSYMGPDRKLVWYDALTMLNVVWYQNTLNYLNLSFSLAAGAVLTNYSWTPALAKQASDIAERSGLGTDNVYFGIDAWAQNSTHGKNTRATYPPKIGGGTGIGMGVQEVAQFGLHVGIFAPGWSFEHFESHHDQVERAIWLGDKVVSKLHCDCTPFGLHLTVPYWKHPVVEFAHRFPSSSSSFMRTGFERAFSRLTRSQNNQELYAHLGCQSILPTIRKSSFQYVDSNAAEVSFADLNIEIRDDPSRCSFSIHVYDTPFRLARKRVCARLRLFDVLIDNKLPLRLTLTYDKLDTTGMDLSFIINECNRTEFPEDSQELATMTMGLTETSLFPIRNIDICLETTVEQLRRVKHGFLNLTGLTIQPQQNSLPTLEIHSVRVEERQTRVPGQPRHRLVWDFTMSPSTIPDGEPHSNITGPFSHFELYLDDAFVGVAFALEYEFARDTYNTMSSWKDDTFTVVGIGFDGTVKASSQELLGLARGQDDDWVLI